MSKLMMNLLKKLRFESLDTLKDAIVKEIGGDYEQLSRLRLKRALLDVLDENHSFELPSAMVEMEYDSIIRQLEQEKKTSQRRNHGGRARRTETNCRTSCSSRVGSC
jgi:FKBP-type peptidyl-prolyl cis-trans isomerase (trigger factor)